MDELEPRMIPLFKYAPGVLEEVERTCSIYKSVLTENNEFLTPENIEAIITVKAL